MKKITGILFSASLMSVLLAIFAISIAVATFIENDFGTLAARALVYNARWFEILLLLGSINLTGRIIVKQLYSREKFTLFLFHISFIVILAGAAITRYTGWEGTMSIREGKTENRVLTDKAYISAQADQNYHFRVSYSPFRHNRFNGQIFHQQQAFDLQLTAFIPNAYLTVEPYAEGIPVAEFIYADSAGRSGVVLEQGERKPAGTIMLDFSDETDNEAVALQLSGDTLYFTAPFPVTISSMEGGAFRVVEPQTKYAFIPRQLYSFNNQTIVLNTFYRSGRITAKPLPPGSGTTYDAAVIKLTTGDLTKEVILSGKAGYAGIPKTINVNGNDIILSYGSIYKTLPFELKLNDFIIERYPGSRSPSSFESQVQLTDPEKAYTKSFRIYMNNILKYRGFRFYQSSYDADEKGTILSVNRDRIGTSVTYAGYAMLGIGMFLSLFTRKSRFRSLPAESRKYEKLKKSLSLIILFIGFNVTAQDRHNLVPPDPELAASFGRILVQDNAGRVEPVNTLSSEVIRKLLRSDTYKTMNSDQVFLGMLTDPSSWQFEPIIRVTNSEVLDFLGTRERYQSFASFFQNQSYILQNHVAEAYRKKPAIRSRFDSEIIKLDEKVNICYLVFTGELLRIFPVPGDRTNTWYSPVAIRGRVLTGDSIFTNNAMPLYRSEVIRAMQTGNWKPAQDVLNAISNFQQKYSSDIIPSTRKVKAEIFLNRSDIFSRISKYYGIAGFILLLIHFLSLFIPRFKTKTPVHIGMAFILVIFLIHTTGLGLRWYVSGHAPWSNGYEALIYVAWASALAGLIFSLRSPVTTAVGSIIAFLTLFVAHLSWMDPQITNLVPVLKSYWLVIHVATITASYGFLAMGALLAYVNLLMISMYHSGNKLYIRYTILELSNTVEMALTIGLYLLTIGVFLGAVWANESWGRYWGWDPKETWALVTVIVYAFILHMRMVPGLRGTLAFNVGSVLAVSSVIMTYFGVNYYLSGLHSYAKGDPLPVPLFVYISLAIVLITTIIAGIRSPKLLASSAEEEVPQ